MDKTMWAVIIQEGTKIISTVLRNRPLSHKEPDTPSSTIIEQTRSISTKAEDIATGCVPCSVGHLGTCTGLLNEAVRFARSDGINSEEVIDRISICTDELNSLERVDLRPEMIADLPHWEKELAEKALTTSRATRHGLESIKSVKDLESVAAQTQSVRMQLSRQWFKERLAGMPEEEKAELAKRAMEKLEQEE